MRVGTSIVLLVFILISFGYVLSDDGHVRKDLKDTLNYAEGLNSQLSETSRGLSACQEEVQQDQQVISAQGTEITVLRERVSTRENEIASLKGIISQQAARINELEMDLVSSQEQKIQLSSAQVSDTGLITGPLALVILLAQIVLVLIQRRRKVPTGSHMPLNGDHQQYQYFRLSPEEISNVVKMRRKKKIVFVDWSVVHTTTDQSLCGQGGWNLTRKS